MRRRVAAGGLLLSIALGACASTIPPVPDPVQVLVVLDSLDGSLRVIPIDSTGVVHQLAIPHGTSVANALAVRGSLAAIGLGDSVLLFDLATARSPCGGPQPLQADGPVGALIFADDGTGYAATPSTDSVSIFRPDCGIGVGGSVDGGPVGFATARTSLFVVVSNLGACDPVGLDCHLESSWLEPYPVRSGDSIPLGGPGNARAAVFGPDGAIYVINASNGRPDGELARVDAVKLARVASYPGFGRLPQYLASNNADRIFVGSPLDGLMVFNARTHEVERGANQAIPFSGLHGLATDDFGRVYVVVPGGCSTGSRGSVHVLGPDLVEQHVIPVGQCPVAIGITAIPADQYTFP